MSFVNKVVDFIQELFRSLNNGYLFFGGWGDLIRSVFDILLIAVLLYWTLLFIKQSRAWQLIKGIVFVVIFVLVCSLLGLEMVGFVFSKFLYVFAIMFVVIFQPELRRILETVGIKSFTSIKGVIINTDEHKEEVNSFIKEISNACMEMSKTYTGALILIERNTKLDELLMQENVVQFESSVTSNVLQSLFYKGAPMHDGGVLIREGKIIAARCHVPLSVTMHSLDRAGTRHRAAVGASEMGDTIAIAVSEERGKTSIAVNGKLYEMQSGTELEANLRYLLGVSDIQDNKRHFGGKKKKNKSKAQIANSNVVVAQTESASDISPFKVSESVQRGAASLKSKSMSTTLVEKIIIILLSLFISFGLWIYIQINNNPVVSKTYVVPINYNNMTIAGDEFLSYKMTEVTVKIVGRQKVLDNLQADDLEAYVDNSNISGSGAVELPVIIKAKDSGIYFRVELQNPDVIPVFINTTEE
ncbi:MAG: diadenylate cyclase [Clostridiales bacterium]|nr:diadenylate cyclase [Clostridiales bacterium]